MLRDSSKYWSPCDLKHKKINNRLNNLFDINNKYLIIIQFINLFKFFVFILIV